LFSRRSDHDSSPNALTLALSRRRANGGELLDLTLSNPTRAGLPYDTDQILEALRQKGALEYEPDAFGMLSARAEVARIWGERGVRTSAERVVLTASTSEAYSFAFKLLCDPGDEVLVPRPSYPLLEHLAVLENITLKSYQLEYDGAWFVDHDSLARAVGPRTRAIVSVSPNNPTGHYLSREDLSRMSAIGLPLISDEVFAEYELAAPASRSRSALEAEAPLVLALDGLSKLAALPQLKLGWMTLSGEPALVEEALSHLSLIADSYLSPNTPVQLALPALLRGRAPVREAILARARANRDKLAALCHDTAVSLLRVEGGWYATLRVPSTHSDEEWALALIEHGVLVQPGYFFDFDSGAYLVVSLLTPEATLAEGAERLVRLVAETSR
jgi:aspartate/methionine/tyrosine aminotransferase